MRLRFTIRDILLVTLITGLALGWWLDHKRLSDEIAVITPQIQPASIIEGRVTYGDTGKPAAGIHIHAQAVACSAGGRDKYGETITDDEGRYRFVNLAPSNYNIWAEADGRTMNAIDSLPVAAGQTVNNVDLELIKGGLIKGRVVDETGIPISFAHGMKVTIGVYGPGRPRTGHAVDAIKVDANGEFQVRVPPGKSYPYIMSVGPQFVVKGSEYQEEGVLVEDGKTVDIEFAIKP